VSNPLNNYRFYYQIGLGAFGKVWKVADKTNGKEYALKAISKQK
jgi:serine/threonine protein kinase